MRAKFMFAAGVALLLGTLMGADSAAARHHRYHGYGYAYAGSYFARATRGGAGHHYGDTNGF